MWLLSQEGRARIGFIRAMLAATNSGKHACLLRTSSEVVYGEIASDVHRE